MPKECRPVLFRLKAQDVVKVLCKSHEMCRHKYFYIYLLSSSGKRVNGEIVLIYCILSTGSAAERLGEIVLMKALLQ